MFESLEYQSQYQTKAGVETILRNTPFAGKTFPYKDPETGAAKTISYTDAFLAAAKQPGVPGKAGGSHRTDYYKQRSDRHQQYLSGHLQFLQYRGYKQ